MKWVNILFIFAPIAILGELLGWSPNRASALKIWACQNAPNWSPRCYAAADLKLR